MVIVFESNLEKVKQMAKKQLEKAMEEMGMAAESHAKLYVTEGVYQSPQGWYIRTGNLRNGITHAVENDGRTMVVGSPTKYAPYVELGTGGGGRKWSYQDANGDWHTTSGMPARPFIRPAIENHVAEYRRILENNMKNG